MSSVEVRRAVGQRSLETQLLLDLFKNEPGPWSYDRLEQVCGRDVRSRSPYRRLLSSAIKAMARDEDVEIVVVSGQGVKRAEAGDCLVLADHGMKEANRKTGVALRRIAHEKYAELSPEDKTRHNTLASQLTVIRLASSPAATKRISSAVAVAQAQLPVEKTLLAFQAESKQEKKG